MSGIPDRDTQRPSRRVPWLNLVALAAIVVAALLLAFKNLGAQDDPHQFLNVSYDPTRELYADLNARFVAQLAKSGAKAPTIRQSHGGSSRQARAVIDGTAADVVTLALFSDIDALRKRGLIAPGWQERLPNHSLPYTSTIVFVVHKGNPRQIKDWPDLLGKEVSIVTPNPRTSGNGKLSFLAAWGSVLRRGGSESDARAFVTELYRHVAVLDSGARAATLHFSQEKIGDVHLAWENEALLEVADSQGELEIAYPPTSIRAEPYVAWVDANVQKKGTLGLAKAYLEFLYTPEAQDRIAEHGYRPTSLAVLERHRARLPELDLFPITTVAKDWPEAELKFFAPDAIFDTISQARRP